MRYDTLTGALPCEENRTLDAVEGYPRATSLLVSLTDRFHQKSPSFGYVAKKEPEKEALW